MPRADLDHAQTPAQQGAADSQSAESCAQSWSFALLRCIAAFVGAALICFGSGTFSVRASEAAAVADSHEPAQEQPASPAPEINNHPHLSTNTVAAATTTNAQPTQLDLLSRKLEQARTFRLMRLPAKAEPVLVDLLAEENPETIHQSALLELSLCAQDENDLPRAQQIYAQFLNRWPTDSRAPEILLRQGRIFRQIGLNSMALAKFYAVMTAALALKSDQLDYYKRLVVDAQSEIAETTYQMGNFSEAAEYFQRLLKQNSPYLKRSQVQFRLVRSLAEIGKHNDAVIQAEDFLTRFPDAAERAEVRFALAHSLKQLGRNSESLRQVLALLKEQKAQTADHPEVWAYWQQRAGNEIANQLYREGDYTKALEVYISLSQLDSAPSWRIPVEYQIGMTYEHLQQPQLASQTYSNILTNEITVGTNATPGMKSVFDMARWRINFIQWQTTAEASTRSITEPIQNEPTRDQAVATDPKSKS